MRTKTLNPPTDLSRTYCLHRRSEFLVKKIMLASVFLMKRNVAFLLVLSRSPLTLREAVFKELNLKSLIIKKNKKTKIEHNV